MTDYGFVHSNRIILSPSIVAEKKAARQKLLVEVEARRKQNYQRHIRKLRNNLNKSKIDPFFD